MQSEKELGGRFAFPGTNLTVHRMGYGAMQLAGPHVFGPPKDRNAALSVLRAAVESGVDHIDTSDFYGPHVTNQIIKEALHPYKSDLVLVTKVGARRGGDGSWIMDTTPEFLRQSIHDNLRNLGLDRLDIVNLRVGGVSSPDDAAIAEPFSALAQLQQEGLIRHLGLSNVSSAQLDEARRIAPVVCVQNYFNVAHREDDAFIDRLESEGVAYVPFFPLGGFNPLQATALNDVAAAVGRTPMAVALAWLLHRSPNILLIPGTSSVAHLQENIAAASLRLAPELLDQLNSIGSQTAAPAN